MKRQLTIILACLSMIAFSSCKEDDGSYVNRVPIFNVTGPENTEGTEKRSDNLHFFSFSQKSTDTKMLLPTDMGTNCCPSTAPTRKLYHVLHYP